MKELTYSEEVELVSELHICGCGTPEVCYAWILEYLKDLDLDNNNWNKYDYDSPEWKYIQIINGFLDYEGFVEHGSTCRCSWLTAKGKRLVKALEYMSKYNFDFDPKDENSEYYKWFWKEIEE